MKVLIFCLQFFVAVAVALAAPTVTVFVHNNNPGHGSPLATVTSDGRLPMKVGFGDQLKLTVQTSPDVNRCGVLLNNIDVPLNDIGAAYAVPTPAGTNPTPVLLTPQIQCFNASGQSSTATAILLAVNPNAPLQVWGVLPAGDYGFNWFDKTQAIARQGIIAPGQILELFGNGFMDSNAIPVRPPAPQLPIQVAGVRVHFGDSATGRDGQIYFLAPGQLTVVAPIDLPLGYSQVTVFRTIGSTITSDTSPISVVAHNPSLFIVWGANPDIPAGLFYRDNGNGVQAFPLTNAIPATLISPTNRQFAVSIFTSGNSDYLSYTCRAFLSDGVNVVAVPDGGVTYTGPAPGFPGLEQTNVVFPNDIIPLAAGSRQLMGLIVQCIRIGNGLDFYDKINSYIPVIKQ